MLLRSIRAYICVYSYSLFARKTNTHNRQCTTTKLWKRIEKGRHTAFYRMMSEYFLERSSGGGRRVQTDPACDTHTLWHRPNATAFSPRGAASTARRTGTTARPKRYPVVPRRRTRSTVVILLLLLFVRFRSENAVSKIKIITVNCANHKFMSTIILFPLTTCELRHYRRSVCFTALVVLRYAQYELSYLRWRIRHM